MAHENGLKNVDGSREMLIAALKTGTGSGIRSVDSDSEESDEETAEE
jgi:hypothetical protein